MQTLAVCPGIANGMPGISILVVTSHNPSLPAAHAEAEFIKPNNTTPDKNFFMLPPH